MTSVISGRVTSPADSTPVTINGIVMPVVPSTSTGPGRPTIVSVPSPSPSQGAVISGVRVVQSPVTTGRGTGNQPVPVSPGGIAPAPSVVISARTTPRSSVVVPTVPSSGQRVISATRGATMIMSGAPTLARTSSAPVHIASPAPSASLQENFAPAPVRSFTVQPSPPQSPGHTESVGAAPRNTFTEMPHSPQTFDNTHSARGDSIDELYRNLLPGEIEDRVSLIRNHYTKMRSDFPSIHMPPIGNDWTPMYLERRYNFFCKQVTKSIYGKLTHVLMAGYFFAMEVFLTNYLGLRAAGYTTSQLNLLSRYSFMFDQVGVVTLTLFDEGASPITQFLVLSVINALVFVAINWIASKLNSDGKGFAESIMGMIAGLTLQEGDKVRQPPDSGFNILNNIDMGSVASQVTRMFGGASAAPAAPVNTSEMVFDDL